MAKSHDLTVKIPSIRSVPEGILQRETEAARYCAAAENIRYYADRGDIGFAGEEMMNSVAARALGLAEKKHGEWDGPAFWGTSETNLEDLLCTLDCLEIFIPALAREWEAWKKEPDE